MSQRADIDRLYREGVTAIRAGDKATARERLMEVVRLEQTHEQAWLWLSAAMDSPEDRILCLENVLTINPSSEAARRGLEKLGHPVPQITVPDSQVPLEPTPGYSAPEEQPLQPPPPEEERPVLEHAPSRIAQMMSQSKDQKHSEGEASWRQSLYDPSLAQVGSNAAFIKDEPVVKRDVLDLLNTWTSMLIFNMSEFRLEAKHGSFWHTLINVAGANLIQAVGSVLFFVVLLLLVQSGQQPALLESLTEIDTGTMSGLDILTASITTQVMFSLIGAVLGIPIVWGFQLLRSWVIDYVAHQLGGKGDIIQTLHAVTIASVAAAIALLPVMLLLPLIPLELAGFIILAVNLYPFLVQAVAVSEVHRLGIFPSLGTLIISGFLTWGIVFGCLCLMVFLANFGAG